MPTKIEKDAVTGKLTTGHEWDGIKELDTPSPAWWLYTLYATIAWGLVWVILYPAIPWFGGATRGLTGWVAREAITEEMAAASAAHAPMLERIRAVPITALLDDATLRDYALAGGRVAFANNCQPCHGAGGQGAPGGYPVLADDEWLWGGTLADIEQTIRHGIRSEEDDDTRRSQMPRFVADGMLTWAQAGDVAEHVLALSGRSTDAAAAARGAPIFAEQCAACHGEKGEGNREQGAPNLADQEWLYGGDRRSIVASIAYARGGMMPAFQGRLDPTTIKMLAAYVHTLGGGEPAAGR
jgi:cytochrome c oxidase cbb3-type subunit 3